MAKHETNVQRRKRESDRQATILGAKLVAESISLIRRTKPELVPECCEAELKRRCRDLLEQMFREFCLCGNAPSKFLRLVADFLDGKAPPYSPGKDWYDDKIKVAYERALNRIIEEKGGYESWLHEESFRGSLRDLLWPSFSEFLEVFHKQNPELQGASDRSLRRSLRRLGCNTRFGKPGRPKQNRDRKPRLTR